MLYEGGIRTPLYVQGPGFSPREITTPVQAFDLFPTLVEVGGGILPPDRTIDGLSLLPMLRGESADRGPLYWHFPAYLEGRDRESREPDRRFRTTPCGAIRDGNWKLIEYFEDGEVELYDLASDRGEQRNVAALQPRQAKMLQEQLVEWRNRLDAPLPKPKVIPTKQSNEQSKGS